MPTGPEDIAVATMNLVAQTTGAGRVFDHVIWPEKNNLSKFVDLVGNPETGDLNAAFVHIAGFQDENPSSYAMARGQEIYTVEIHHVRGINNQFDPQVNSTKLFRAFMFNLIAKFKLRVNFDLGLNSLVSHTALRSFGRMPPLSEYGSFYVHYGILVMEVLNGDCPP